MNNNIVKNEYVGCNVRYEMRRMFKIVLRDVSGKLYTYGEMKQKEFDYIYSLIDPKVNWDSPVEDDRRIKRIMQERMVSKQPHVPKHIGWIIDKELPTNRDIGLTRRAFGPVVDIVRPHVKEAIEKAELTGAYFQPVWIKGIEDINKPDYYTLNSTNPLNFKISTGFDSNGAEVLSANLRSSMIDFNFIKYNPDGVEVSHIEPYIISQKAYEVMKVFKPIEFGPVVFE